MAQSCGPSSCAVQIAPLPSVRVESAGRLSVAALPSGTKAQSPDAADFGRNSIACDGDRLLRDRGRQTPLRVGRPGQRRIVQPFRRAEGGRMRPYSGALGCSASTMSRISCNRTISRRLRQAVMPSACCRGAACRSCQGAVKPCRSKAAGRRAGRSGDHKVSDMAAKAAEQGAAGLLAPGQGPPPFAHSALSAGLAFSRP